MSSTVSKPIQILVLLASLVVIMAGLKSAESIITPLLLAVFIAAISSPAYFWLLGKRVPTLGALLIIISAVFVIGTLMSVLIRGSLAGFTENLPFYQQRLGEVWFDVLHLLSGFGLLIDSKQLASSADVPALMGLVGNTLNRLVGMFTSAFFILLALVFILTEMGMLHKKIRAISSNPEQSIAKLDYFLSTLNQYFAMKTLISAATGLLAYIGLKVLDIDYPILWALIAFMLNFVPTVGSLVAAVPAILMAVCSGLVN